MAVMAAVQIKRKNAPRERETLRDERTEQARTAARSENRRQRRIVENTRESKSKKRKRYIVKVKAIAICDRRGDEGANNAEY